MPSNEFLLLAVGAMCAGFVQGIAGFAFGMVAMSFWVWGVEPHVAAVMTVFGSLVGQLLAVTREKRALDLPVMLPFLIGGVIGIPVGVTILPHLNPTHFKLALGTILLVFCPAMLLAPRLPAIRGTGRFSDGIVGAVGGAMGGIGGFSGVAPALWCTLRGYDKDAHRAIQQNFNLTALSITMVAMLVSGVVTRDMLPKFAIVAPALLLPAILGAKVYTGLSPLAFRRVVLGLLCLSGIAMITASLPSFARL
ncbi:sulfite exporter TauE/SafE family protein [Uliginosibacterium sp. H3]|uniref:Probable membrane transporter protein n=1 Tax=Uliginosibacterium silvisoli TaxID=3114758 RepID=A0ABU6K7J2_9RHOO|nr:sulfite exporter TauE/SafE family protein [Uliginosibacterium sp. H3]